MQQRIRKRRAFVSPRRFLYCIRSHGISTTYALEALKEAEEYSVTISASNASGTTIGNTVSFTVMPDVNVTFYDTISETEIDTVSVPYGHGAVAVKSPVYEGHTFSKWDKAFDKVTEDITVNTVYDKNAYRVRFIDSFTNKVLDTQTVKYKEAAEEISVSAPEGYLFAGWNKDVSSVTEDTDVYTVYQWGDMDHPARGNSVRLSYVLTDNTDTGYDVEWSSENASVASVDEKGLVAILSLISAVPAFAADTGAVISAEDVWLTDGTVLVPVTIADNPGIMGFRITVEYPSDLLEISNAVAGSITSKGSFIHSIGKKDSKGDIVWYSTAQTENNGTLFVLTVKAGASFKKGDSARVTLTYSQADTFNENYEDVAFECRPIVFRYGEKDPSADHDPQNTQGSPENTPGDPVTDSQLVTAVEAALDNSGIDSINDIDTKVLDKVNAHLKTITGSDTSSVGDVDELKSRYKEAVIHEYVSKAQIDIDPERINGILNDALNSRGVKSPDELSDEQKEDAVLEALEKLSAEDDTLPDLSEKLSADEMTGLFDQLRNEPTAEQQPKEANDQTFPIIPIIAAAAAVCGIAVVLLIVRKKRKNK